MRGFRAELVQALDESKSLFEVNLMMEGVVDDLKKVRGDVNINESLQNFQEGVPMMQMATLLHYMNVKLLRSIVAGTLAFDLYQADDLDASCQYDDEASAGTYVVSLSIEGRQGRFLNYHELGQLAGHIETYAEYASMWVRNDHAWNYLDARHLVARSFIEEVDNKASQADADSKPLFGATASAVQKLEELARMFDRRADPTLDVQNGGQTHQVQAPLMVGCTTEKIAKEAKAHYPQWAQGNPRVPAAGSLQSTMNTWGLTVSLIYYLKLIPVIVHVAALPFMYPADLPRTEILLTTLARSLVWQDGFNVTQGGGKQDDPQQVRGYAEQKNVCHARDFLKNNLAATLQRIQEVRNKISTIENLGEMDLDALKAEINKLKAKENELQLAVVEFEEVDAEFMTRYNQLKEIEELQDEALAQWKGWNTFLDSLKRE